MIDHTGIGGADMACFHPRGAKHTAFAAGSRAEVEAFRAAAPRAGGTDNGLPGIRPISKGYPPGYYAAFVLDPDGNNMEAAFREGRTDGGDHLNRAADV